jgi:acyl transferase domain-containing protein
VGEEAAAKKAFLLCGADIADPGAFDAAFFGFTPEEARLTDPQQRLFLECAWGAPEDAAILPKNQGERVGVFGAMESRPPERILQPQLGNGPLLGRSAELEEIGAIIGRR